MMQVFKIILDYEDGGVTRFFFADETAGHLFFRWLCETYGHNAGWNFRFQSEVSTSEEAAMDDAEAARRSMVWDLWHACNAKKQDADKPRILH